MSLTTTSIVPASVSPARGARDRALAGACLAHFVHDGFTDLLYVLLPVWQQQFGLDYVALAVMRALYAGTMGGLQIPADRWTKQFGGRLTLVMATLVAAGGYLVLSLPGGMATLCVGLVLAGLGSSAQHPRGSMLVSDAYGSAVRRPLGIYNFAGDLRKAAFPPFVSLLLLWLAWRQVTLAIAALGVVGAIALACLLPRHAAAAPAPSLHNAITGSRRGFNLLLAAGVLDTATRMGLLLFLPFLLHAKGGGSAVVGFALAALFVGGAFGKAVCGSLGDRFGVVRCVIGTELATGMLIGAVLFLPLWPALVALPVLGIVLNGTSSILYGTVPELSPTRDTGRAFAIFYTGVIGSGALAPILFGAIGDHAGRTPGVITTALSAFAIVPIVLAMRSDLDARAGTS